MGKDSRSKHKWVATACDCTFSGPEKHISKKQIAPKVVIFLAIVLGMSAEKDMRVSVALFYLIRKGAV